MSKIQYVTTAIVYPNNRMHLGFGWECIGADWYVRSLKALGHETFFVTGMDEHAINVKKAALAKGLTPKAYCDEFVRLIAQAPKLMKKDKEFNPILAIEEISDGFSEPVVESFRKIFHVALDEVTVQKSNTRKKASSDKTSAKTSSKTAAKKSKKK